MVRRRNPPLWRHGNTDGPDHIHTSDAEVDHIHGDNGGVRATGGQMADGLCAVDAGSTAEWKPVASAAETSCATHLGRRIEATAAARGVPRAHPWMPHRPGGAILWRHILIQEIAIARTGIDHGNSSNVEAFLG
jgi:hypothetical protein